MTEQSYLMAEVWNSALEDKEEREMKPREKLWASELGGAPIDLYLKLKGTPLTNPPNARAKRKFEAGNVHEWIVSLVLKRANILVESQRWAEFRYSPAHLPVSGKADFIAGRVPNIEEGEKFLAFLERAEFPDVFIRGFDRVLKHIAEKYPKGFDDEPLEVKSVSSFAMDLMERTKEPVKRHKIQLFHYLKSMKFDRGRLIYICRDDLRMMEFPVYASDNRVEDEYRGAIEAVSKYYYADKMPPKEKKLIWEGGKFSKNLNISWSGYLTMLYDYKEPREYDEVYGKVSANWNRVMSRVKNGAKMTAKNEEVLEAIRKEGFVVEELVTQMADEAVEDDE